MTFLHVISVASISLGPSLVLLFSTVLSDPLKCVILIASAFFWLLSLFLTSIIWFIIIPLRDKILFAVILSVILQEIFKYMWYRMLRISEKGLQKISNIGHNNDHYIHFKGKNDRLIVSYVCGLGFGLANGYLSIINPLFDLNGPGTYGIYELGFKSYLMNKSFCSQGFIFFNIFWTIILYDGYDKKEYTKVVLVIVTHLLAAILTYLNVYNIHLTVLFIYLLMIILAVYTMKLWGLTFKSFCRSIKLFTGIN